MNDEKSRKEPENRRSRFVWMPGEIEIIKNPDQDDKGVPAAPTTPPSPDPAAPKPKKDDDQQDG